MANDNVNKPESKKTVNKIEYCFEQSKDHEKVPAHYILLDSESTHDTFYIKGYLRNIRKADTPIRVNTNGGIMICDMVGDLPGYGWVYYNPNGIANILSMARVEENGRRITYDTHNGGCFKVHNYESGKVLIFGRLNCGLFAMDTRSKKSFSFINMVEDNNTFFTPIQIDRAKAAMDLYEMIGFPSLRDYKGAVKNGMLGKIKVDSKDI